LVLVDQAGLSTVEHEARIDLRGGAGGPVLVESDLGCREASGGGGLAHGLGTFEQHRTMCAKSRRDTFFDHAFAVVGHFTLAPGGIDKAIVPEPP
jgi:hypothetical protein